ncbi:MAG TPA: ABC transporter permease subunit [Thermoplasmata archaeon]|nr:ABC transporter permease subunit [Thermoplasmata archaeon]
MTEPAPPPDLPPPPSAWRRVHRVGLQLLDTPALLLGLALAGFFVAVSLDAVLTFGPHLDTMYVRATWVSTIYPPGPSPTHPLGVMDGLGVDEATAMFQAAPWDITLVAGITFPAALLGLFLGSEAGAGNRIASALVVTGGDLVLTIPAPFLVVLVFLSLSRFLYPSQYLWVFGIAFVAILWPYHARGVRQQALIVAQESFVEAARAAGASRGWVTRRHILPNSFVPVLSQIPVDVASIFFVLTAFPYVSCLGGGGTASAFAITSPLPSRAFPEWGWLAANGACYGYAPIFAANFWWMYLFPIAAIALFSAMVVLLCDGVARFVERSERQ